MPAFSFKLDSSYYFEPERFIEAVFAMGWEFKMEELRI